MSSNYKKYSNKEHPIEILYPPEWKAIENFAGTLVTFLSPYENKKDKFREMIDIITVEFLHPALDILAEFSQRSVKELRKSVTAFKLVKNLSEATLAGFPAKEVEYHHREQDLNLKSYAIWTVVKYQAYIIATTAVRKKFKEYKPIFDKMIESFKIDKDALESLSEKVQRKTQSKD